MVRIPVIILFLSVFFVCCNKTNSPNPDTYLFDFNFNAENTYISTLSADSISIPYGYLMDEYIYDLQPSQTSNIYFSNGVFPDTLVVSCGNYNYITNPTTVVKIWFSHTSLENGLYTYSKDSANNDFSIYIFSNMIFDTTFSNYSHLVSRDLIASPFYSYQYPHNVVSAQIKIDNYGTSSPEIRFALTTVSGDLIRGSYIGELESFKLKSSSADCD